MTRVLWASSLCFFDILLAYPSREILRQEKGRSGFSVIHSLVPVVALLFYFLPFGLPYMIYIALVRSVPLITVEYCCYFNCLGILYIVCCTIRPIELNFSNTSFTVVTSDFAPTPLCPFTVEAVWWRRCGCSLQSLLIDSVAHR